MTLIDAHVHFWDPDRLHYPWLADVDRLHRPYGPADLQAERPLPDAVVFVEAGRLADQALDELAWVDELASRWPRIRAVVAHASLDRGSAAATELARLAGHPMVKGVRRNLQDEAAGFGTQQSFVDGVRALADLDLSFDLCVRHSQLPEVTTLAASVPEVSFVLDHLGKPPVAAGALEPWRTDLARLAALPNVTCKLSGLATEAHWTQWTDDDVLPFVSLALTEFGPDRCMFGSDWPVATLATTYSRWVDLVRTALAAWPASTHRAVFAGTAARVYRLEG